MRKCYLCQQMRPVVTQVKKPDGKRGYVCPGCVPTDEAVLYARLYASLVREDEREHKQERGTP